MYFFSFNMLLRIVVKAIFSIWMLVLLLPKCSPTKLRRGRRIDSDSADYEDFYDELDTEYAQSLFKTTPPAVVYRQVTSDSEWVKQYDTPKVSEQVLQIKKSPGKALKLTDDTATEKLHCDDPWFWNTFKCVWLDLRAKKTLKRTQRNAKKAGIILGILCLLIVLPLCWICVVTLYFRSRVAKYSKLMEQYMKEYMPGSIILPNGEVKYYDPTQEEQEAFEDLIHAISSPV